MQGSLRDQMDLPDYNLIAREMPHDEISSPSGSNDIRQMKG